MIREIENIMSNGKYTYMRRNVIRMNENVETIIYDEMLHHKEDYDEITGLRKTHFTPQGSWIQYDCISVVGAGECPIGLEYVKKKNGVKESKEKQAVLYIHGAAFQRRTQDINMRTAERICEMTGCPVYVPDYRIGIDYHMDEMIGDIIASYRYLVRDCGYQGKNLILIADSSGCTSLMAALQKLEEKELPGPGYVILMSPFTDAGLTNPSIEKNRMKDIAFISNHLFETSVRVFTRGGKLDVGRAEISPIAGNYRCLRDTKVLIQVGKDERLLDDSIRMYYKLSRICSCTLEIYENMFHNFSTYFSICDMAKVSWKHSVDFLTA